MRLTLYAVPASEPISISELEVHSRLGTGGIAALGQTTVANIYIAAARQRCEAITRRQLVTATWDYSLDSFPTGREPIEIPLPPLQTISSISYTDSDGAAKTFTAYRTVKEISPKAQPAIIFPTTGYVWPVALDEPATVVIRFVAGYTTGNLLPESIKNWLLLNTAALWENRESFVIDTGKEFDLSKSVADGLLEDYRIYRF